MKKLNNKSKPAFTLVELVFIIIIVGILAAILLPKLQGSRLREAADQIVSHIRYTQHLAISDNKFNPNDEQWYKGRWQIAFERADRTDNLWSYSIFSENADYTGNPDVGEMARNPQIITKVLSGGSSAIASSNPRATKQLHIGKAYGISNVTFAPSCSYRNSHRITFDYLGRPLAGNMKSYDDIYMKNRIITQQCVITLRNDAQEEIQIAIEAESGYAHIL